MVETITKPPQDELSRFVNMDEKYIKTILFELCYDIRCLLIILKYHDLIHTLDVKDFKSDTTVKLFENITTKTKG